MEPTGKQTSGKGVPIVVAPEQLSPEALTGIIASFVLREGTDYGLVEVPFEEKVAQVRRLIERGEIHITFDRESETVSLVDEHDLRRDSK